MARERKKTLRRPSKRVLEAISEALEEIDAHFELSGFSGRKSEKTRGETVEQAESRTDSADDDEDDDYADSYQPDSFDREDIEIALDEFISSLVAANVIRKGRTGKLLSFSEVFEKYFGEDHEISANANKFEEYIKGYFDAIDPENMDAAYKEFREIQEIVRKELEGSNGKE